ncbi:DNA primase noncatalytic subunit PriX [Candidatus Nitrosocosmicus hydrocola]|uniref:DNA primase noncatalytic subunit PriX n=1 Tax=Candidatus Nitrosocosmicus hydrocola TaxID=1826872 RepID=UPI0011E5FAA4|nr:DNA primase noncatalytic subunit PriX [Candidatus Nitrosocosmicus hydrocola]
MIFGNNDCTNNHSKKERIKKVKEGIDFILSHFEGRQQLFPRKISTAFSNNGQFTVYNKEQILNECIKADFMDCRINAYPVLDKNDCLSYSNIQSPNIIFIDFDLDKSLPYQKAITKLEKTKNRSIQTIKERLIGSQPTILWTGNGYHIYIVINTRPLELIKELSELSKNPSEEFLRYAELTFSNKKKDSSHNSSFKSSLLRIPYTFNSKNLLTNNENDREKAEVSIVQKFDNDNIKPINIKLLRDYRLWLADDDLLRKKKKKNSRLKSCNIIDKKDLAKKYFWIERLLQTPLPCFRRYCLYRILVPYLVNVRKLNDEECFGVLKKWLEKCNNISIIPFNIESEIKTRLNGVKDYEPLSLYKLRKENSELYHLLN